MRLTARLDDSSLQRGIARVLKAAQESLDDSAEAGAAVIADEWRLLFQATDAESIAGLPPRIQTGDYLNSIEIQPGERTATRSDQVVLTTLTDPPYPRFLEFGTVKMPAHPIARPAYDTQKADAAEVARTLMWDRIRAAL